MRIAIIGMGGAGSMAAWRLAEAGHEVFAFEQFRIDHDLGSSYGGSRLVRQLYPDPFYTKLMTHAFELWDELQGKWSAEELICRRGGLFLGPSNHPLLTQARQALHSSSVPFFELSAAEVNAKYPGISLDNSEAALFEPGMGYARASRCVQAATALAERNGAVIREYSTVINVDLGTDVCITLDGNRKIVVDKAVLTAGPWVNRLLSTLGPPIPLTVTRQVYCHFSSTEAVYNPANFPCWIDCDSLHYGFPEIGKNDGVKLARHVPGQVTSPESVDREVSPSELGELAEYASRRLPRLIPHPAYRKVCLYSNTSDEDFIVDTLPTDSRVVIASACSGHGFKFVPLIGQIIKELVVDGSSVFDISRFSINRFQSG